MLCRATMDAVEHHEPKVTDDHPLHHDYTSYPPLMATTIPNTSSPTDATENTDACEANAQAKLKRFRFTETYDTFLLRAVRSVDAHLPDRVNTERLYKQVLKTFMQQVPGVVFQHLHAPSCKTLSDLFKRLIAQRRDYVKRTSTASGFVEQHGDKEGLMGDLILEIDEIEETCRVEKDEITQLEQRFVAAGEEIRSLALKRRA
ncbi:unnamed protein product [Agarophyton chilense]